MIDVKSSKSLINQNSLTWDYQGPAYAPTTPAINILNSAQNFIIKGVRITSSALIENPWGLLAPLWNKCAVQQAINNEYWIYTLNFPDNETLTLSQGSNLLLNYAAINYNNLGVLGNIAMPPRKIEVFDGQNWIEVGLNNPNPQPNPNINFSITVDHAYAQAQYTNGYVEAWDDINGLTFTSIAFDTAGNIYSFGAPDTSHDQFELPMMYMEQQRRSYLNTSLSFGGWGPFNNYQPTSAIFSVMAANSGNRDYFVNNILRALTQTGAKGVDIDWQDMIPTDVENFIALISAIRQVLPTGKRLTITVPGRIDQINMFTPTQWQQVASLVDEMRITAYDYFGAFAPTTTACADFHSAYKLSSNSPNAGTHFDVNTTLQRYLSLGIASKKFALGLPNYARAVIVDDVGSYGGLYQKIVAIPDGEYVGSKSGIYSWDAIQKHINGQPSPLDWLGVEKWYFYDSTTSICQEAGMCLMCGQLPTGQWIVMTFLDPASAIQRTQLVKDKGLAGVIERANCFESTNHNNSIIGAIAHGLSMPSPAAQNALTHAKYLAARDSLGEAKANVLQQLAMEKDYYKALKIVNDNEKILKSHNDYVIGFFKNTQSWNLAQKLLEDKHAWKPTAIINNNRFQKRPLTIQEEIQKHMKSLRKANTTFAQEKVRILEKVLRREQLSDEEKASLATHRHGFSSLFRNTKSFKLAERLPARELIPPSLYPSVTPGR